MTQVPAQPPKKFHPALVALHWLIAILIFTEIYLAFGGGEGRRQSGPATLGGIPIINLHMLFGILILVLLIVRLVVRFTTQRPAWASTGNEFLNKIGELTHWGLYLLTFGMTITGIILASSSNRLARLFGLASTPGQFRGGLGFSLGEFHGMIWIFLFLLIALHVGAALYHQFLLKDNLLSRMSFGKRYE